MTAVTDAKAPSGKTAAPVASAPGRATRAFAAYEWMIAGRYLRSRGGEGVISIIAGFSLVGIMLGVATLIIVMSVMNGFRTQLLEKILGVNGHLTIQSMAGPFVDFDPSVAALAKLEGVVSAIPYVEGQVMVSADRASSGALVRGLRGADLMTLEQVSTNIRFGTLEGFDQSGGVAVGSRLANSLGLGLGEKITLVAPRGAVTPFGTAPRIKSYPIVAIFEVGMSEYDSNLVFMPLGEAQPFFNKPDAISAIEIFVDDPDEIGKIRPSVKTVLPGQFFLTDWRERNRTFFSALEVERDLMFIIVSLIILVAALNIISGLTMLVKDKRRDIGILRTMGATRGGIMRVFFITGASIGIVGTILGFIVGLVFCLNIESIRQFVSRLTGTALFDPSLYFLSKLPAEINPSEITSIVAMSLTLTFIATLYPAWRAARLDPVKALNNE
ncbi:Lipoprotein releasing system transmembrane protein LolC/LolE [hydrothermal vent metagenome]|uniref:Lipoprotein releasing system transmembrane protein LolC/LolE n=1 Tax=hydrothermal vent metagenome TaxID=652676 RepID=A0A3B0TZ89_9ZZZZ